MQFFNLLFLLSAATSGVFAGQCASSDVTKDKYYNNDSEDFTYPPSKRGLEGVEEFESYEEPRSENALDVRANRHWCGTPTDSNGATRGKYVADSNSEYAVGVGHTLLINGHSRVSGTGVHYPHIFRNNENIPDVTFYCPAGPYFEFPVYPNPNREFGSNTNNPGPDRVIFDLCGNWCTTITHRGESNNRFHGCTPS